MSGRAEGVPCWADAVLPDLEAGRKFYGELFGWTFQQAAPEYGGYTQAESDGRLVAALSPPMPGADMPAAWTVYLASSDADAAAARITDQGGQVLQEPMTVGDFGRMLIAQPPGGGVFGVWQPGTHQGFQREGEPNSYIWTEVLTREPEAVDTFFETVFPFRGAQLDDDTVDYRIWETDGEQVAGRMRMTDEFPDELPAHLAVYFAVSDCDAAIETVRRLGGTVEFGPADTPYGRLASVADPQGARFHVVDPATTVGEAPATR
ncbi:VOC family protein [Streptomyces sp. 549]|uniref:VOC family protein n=1 Tax=Streptomyces sp. 549 TaxID=3049076 RepID=UPI0024C44DD2|nr:VOC family protein [Streptomyces sp. 549]MDK1472223.1 VOC family protein [Streptomyces sp. 549]